MTQPMIMILLPLLALAMATGAALAQQRTCYDGGGRVTGRSSTDSQGSTTIYDSARARHWPHVHRHPGYDPVL